MAELEPRWFIAGGAGFIGSHVIDRLLGDSAVEGVTVFDNFSSGREWHYANHHGDDRLAVVRGDARDVDALAEAMADHDVVIHLASNPDIAAAITNPDIDFEQGTLLTRGVVEAMRRAGVHRILYASGSGIYGDLGEFAPAEDHGPLEPVSTYGASKIAGETLIAAYAHMFGIRGCAFRFGNVVGPRQTHGVGFDFVRKLLEDPAQLEILGDGRQSKSYIHVGDVIEAVLLAHARVESPFAAFNVATGDYITVTEIAELAVAAVGLDAAVVQLRYTGGRSGWLGDVPVMRLDTTKIRDLGWVCRRNTRDALRDALDALVDRCHAAGARVIDRHARRAAAFLDRDGVLNVSPVVDGVPRPPSPEDLQLLDGVEDACAALAGAGLTLVVVTNQPDIARGTLTRAEVDDIHRRLAERLPITEFRVCPHDDGDGCDCRKPAPGLLLQATTDLGIDLTRSVIVGDRWRDVEAGRAAGVHTVFVDHGYAEALPHPPDLTVPDLATAVAYILEHARAS